MARRQQRRQTYMKQRPKPKQQVHSYREVAEARKQRKLEGKEPSLEGLFSAALVGPLGYLAVESIMNDNRHPIHWVVAILLGIIGYGVGHAVYRWREAH